MEQLIHVPFRCTIKLSRDELWALNLIIGRITPAQGIEAAATFEWAIKKRLAFAAKLLQNKKQYTLTLKASDAHYMTLLFDSVEIYNPYEYHVRRHIEDKIGRIV